MFIRIQPQTTYLTLVDYSIYAIEYDKDKRNLAIVYPSATTDYKFHIYTHATRNYIFKIRKNGTWE